MKIEVLMTSAILTLQVQVSKEKTNSGCRNLFVRNKSFLFHMDGSSNALTVSEECHMPSGQGDGLQQFMFFTHYGKREKTLSR